MPNYRGDGYRRPVLALWPKAEIGGEMIDRVMLCRAMGIEMETRCEVAKDGKRPMCSLYMDCTKCEHSQLIYPDGPTLRKAVLEFLPAQGEEAK